MSGGTGFNLDATNTQAAGGGLGDFYFSTGPKNIAAPGLFGGSAGGSGIIQEVMVGVIVAVATVFLLSALKRSKG